MAILKEEPSRDVLEGEGPLIELIVGRVERVEGGRGRSLRVWSCLHLWALPLKSIHFEFDISLSPFAKEFKSTISFNLHDDTTIYRVLSRRKFNLYVVFCFDTTRT